MTLSVAVPAMCDNFNRLTPQENEALSILGEECGEVAQALGRIQQVLGKIHRHGLDSRNPFDPASLSNRESLEVELADVLVAIDVLAKLGVIRPEMLPALKAAKLRKLPRFLHHINLDELG